MALPLIATIHAARLEARFIKAMAAGRLAPPVRGWYAEPEADPTATPHITTRADIEVMDRLRASLKAANGTAADAQRKVLAQGKELHDLQVAHTRLRSNLTKVQEERDELKKILEECAPTIHAHWLRAKKLAEAKAARATDIPQTHETHGD